MKTHRNLLAATGLVAALALTGCGGGNDDSQAATAVPDSAGASSASFVSYIQGLSDSDETSEPLSIPESFSGPANETDDPIPLT